MGTEACSSLLVVEKSEVILVKPSKPTPDVSLSLSTIDNDPFFEVIIQTICIFAPKPYIEDQANHDPTKLLKHALSHALVYYYPFAGKLHRKSDDNRLELNCTAGDGVPYVRATADCTLASLNYLENAGDEAYQLVPCYNPVKEGYDPLALQVTKFACGGITIGMAHSHSVCDGVGVTQFVRAMIELASGKTKPSVIPVWERERLTFNGINDKLGDDKQNPKLVKLPKSSSSIATSPYIPSDDMVREILNITDDDITKLKKIIANEEEKFTNENNNNMPSLEAVTTLEIIAALMWRSRCRALKLNPEGTTALEIAVSIRSITEPPLPEGYYGNACVSASVALTAKELTESSLSRVVRLIKDMKRSVLDKRYVSGKLSVTETSLKETASLEGHNGGLVTLTDWRQIGLGYKGWGGLVNIIPLVPMTMPFLCVLLPTSKAVQGMSGGVRLLVTLPRDAMAKFKEEMNAF